MKLPVGVGELLPVPDAELVGVSKGPAPCDRDAVGVTLDVGVRLLDGVGELLPVPDAELVGTPPHATALREFHPDPGPVASQALH